MQPAGLSIRRTSTKTRRQISLGKIGRCR